MRHPYGVNPNAEHYDPRVLTALERERNPLPALERERVRLVGQPARTVPAPVTREQGDRHLHNLAAAIDAHDRAVLARQAGAA